MANPIPEFGTPAPWAERNEVWLDTRWYVVPTYRPDGQPSRSATVVNRAGELVATFESLEDAERAVEAVNGRT